MSQPGRRIKRGGRAPVAPLPIQETIRWRLNSPALVSAGLIVLVVAVFTHAFTAEFVNFDDPHYVVANPNVSAGLVWDNVYWAFTSYHASNWHPLTWLSHMLDCELFGLEPSGHHAVSVFIHAANAAILFWVLRRLTGEFWPSAAVAALWAIHPLRVESVAWVSERKDVLSGLFFLLTIAAYTTYVRSPSILRYSLVLLLFGLGLMAKPMLVTTPFVLLLLDYWPLKRIDFSRQNVALRFALLEKLPLLGMSVISSLLTMSAQTTAMVWGTERLTFEDRFANMLVSYVIYVWQFLYPRDLAVLYPHPLGKFAIWQVGASAILLAAITVGTLSRIRSAPYLAVGWFWFLGMLVPVIGLIQVGAQAHADRYTYLPQIGLIWAIVWAVQSVAPARIALVILLGSVLSFTVNSWFQVKVWQDSLQLFLHAVNNTGPNQEIQNLLGVEFAKRGLDDKAVEHYRLAIDIDPNYVLPRLNLAVILIDRGQYGEAVDLVRGIVERKSTLTDSEKSNWASLHHGIGVRLSRESRYPDAIDYIQQALKISPDQQHIRRSLAKAYLDYGAAQRQAGRTADAVTLLQKAIETEPDLAAAHISLGEILREMGKVEEAAASFRRALELEPNNKIARKNLVDLQSKSRP